MPKKKVISKKLREEVWLKYFGKKFSSKCPIQWCTREISVFAFEVGHNIPESKGGKTTIDNLIPICGDCNRSMGDRYTIDEFSKEFAASASASLSAAVPKTIFQRFFGCFIRQQTKPQVIRKHSNLERNRSFVRTIYK